MSAEICDDLDNDCDGVADNGLVCDCLNDQVEACYTAAPDTEGIGICHAGIRVCIDGTWDICIDEVTPTGEICDGLDNDCNEMEDDGLMCDCLNDQEELCYTGAPDTEDMGVCHAGSRICIDGIWDACIDEVTPTDEICDGLDNDCNGMDDDEIVCL